MVKPEKKQSKKVKIDPREIQNEEQRASDAAWASQSKEQAQRVARGMKEQG